MDSLYQLQMLKRLARLQRQATIVAGIIGRRADGKIDAPTAVREARMVDAEIQRQAEAEVE